MICGTTAHIIVHKSWHLHYRRWFLGRQHISLYTDHGTYTTGDDSWDDSTYHCTFIRTNLFIRSIRKFSFLFSFFVNFVWFQILYFPVIVWRNIIKLSCFGFAVFHTLLHSNKLVSINNSSVTQPILRVVSKHHTLYTLFI